MAHNNEPVSQTLSPMTLRSKLKRHELLEPSDIALSWYRYCDEWTDDDPAAVLPTFANLQLNKSNI